MKRIQYSKYGGADLLHLDEVELAAPARGEVLVRVHAAAANPMDWVIRNGEVKIMTGRRFPRGLGHDFAGTVTAVGEGMTRIHVGDEVLGASSLKAAGAFAETIIANEQLVVAKPPALSFEEAAALVTVGVTAVQAVLDKGQADAGAHVFVNGAQGGVGRAAVQIARMHGAHVAGSCRNPASDDARGLALDPAVGFGFDPADMRGRFDLVIDTAGTLPFNKARALLKPGGRVVDINVSPSKLLRGIVIRGYKPLTAQYTTGALQAVADAAANGDLFIPIARTVPLAQAIEALTELERTRAFHGGKLIISPL